jgi:hypothetical protein
VVTKSELSSGKSLVMNMVLTPLVLILVTLIYSWKESMSTIMKPLEEDMSQELS